MPDRRSRSADYIGIHFTTRMVYGARRETLGGAADDLFIEPGMPHKADDATEVLLEDTAAKLFRRAAKGAFCVD
jgi:hypothetical protein